ncbi:MAG TPA: response regulator [Flavisolibacter sp.]|nr:response regulator [Flavisolibacter sp.]
MSKGIILVCDNDTDEVFTLQEGLKSEGFEVIVIQQATELVATASNLKPTAVIANPDMKGFNEYDVCKHIKQKLNLPVLLLIDRNSTARSTIGDCTADDVISKPVQSIGNITTLILKHKTLYQQK